MSEGITRIMTTPSAAHSSPRAPNPKATQRALELPPMSACTAGARGARVQTQTATEATEANEMTEAEAPSAAAAAASCVPGGGRSSSSPAGGQRLYAPWPGQPAPEFRAGFRRGVGKGGEWAGLGWRGVGVASVGSRPSELLGFPSSGTGLDSRCAIPLRAFWWLLGLGGNRCALR